jgi:capsular polysaccharide export protein
VYKPHPDVVAGLRAAGQGESEALRHCDEVLPHQSSHALYPQVDEVHVMTSLAGFEALLRGVSVTCWGQPFYAGWGLTADARAHPRRTRTLSLDQLVAGTLLLYATYCDPRTGLHCTAEDALHALLQWRERTGGRLPWWRRALRPLIARP